MYGLRREYFFGIVIGALLGAVVSALGGALGYTVTISDGLFWGAVVGGILSAIPQFSRSGAVMTRRTHKGLNLSVGLIGSLVFVAVVALLSIALAEFFF